MANMPPAIPGCQCSACIQANNGTKLNTTKALFTPTDEEFNYITNPPLMMSGGSFVDTLYFVYLRDTTGSAKLTSNIVPCVGRMIGSNNSEIEFESVTASKAMSFVANLYVPDHGSKDYDIYVYAPNGFWGMPDRYSGPLWMNYNGYRKILELRDNGMSATSGPTKRQTPLSCHSCKVPNPYAELSDTNSVDGKFFCYSCRSSNRMIVK